MIDIGNKIKDLRNELQLSQKQIAEMLNIAQNTFSQIETNTRQPSLELLIKIAKLFQVSTDYILGLEDEAGQKTYINSFNNMNITCNSGTIKF
ncbi:helix-turn-helix domain-containing protein [Pumilibacter intestinalis]|uniref:helix-turn-helix domain-containing protein n=1 Tax=Pumilibacter intestinalis TaxID=2941511 RepID=UPI0020402D52|nr:helix-turn-helix transcriptional regulator [Pumilibacter intestinalis]